MFWRFFLIYHRILCARFGDLMEREGGFNAEIMGFNGDLMEIE